MSANSLTVTGMLFAVFIGWMLSGPAAAATNTRDIDLSIDRSYRYDETPRTYQWRIGDIFSNQGEVLDRKSNQAIGTYKVFEYPSTVTAARGILHAAIPDGNYHSLFLLIDPGRSRLVYLGTASTSWLSASAFSPDQYGRPPFSPNLTADYWAALAKVFGANPSSVTTDDIALMRHFVFAPGESVDVREIREPNFTAFFVPMFVRRLLALAENGAQIDWNMLPVQGRGLMWPLWVNYPTVSAPNREEVLSQLTSVWSKLSFDGKYYFLRELQTGDAKAAQLLAPLLKSFFSEASTADANRIPLGNLFLTHSTAVLNLDTPEVTRQDLVAAAAHFLKKRDPNRFLVGIEQLKHFSDLCASMRQISSFDGWCVGLRDEVLRHALETNVIASPVSYYRTLSFTYTINPSLLTQEQRTTVEQERQKWKQALSAEDLTRWELPRLNALLGSSDDENAVVVQSDAPLRSKAVTQALQAVTAFLASGGTDVSMIVDVIAAAVQRMKEYAQFPDDVTVIFPLLERVNPKQTGESNTQYAARLQRLKDLWKQQRVIFVDMTGGLYHGTLGIGKSGVTYADLVAEFGNAVPGWANVFWLRHEGNTTAFPWGRIAMNWPSGTNPRDFMTILLHEGAHAGHAQFNKDSAWGIVQPYWFYESFGAPSYNRVSDYSKVNLQENFAELHAYWRVDSETWLLKAIQDFQEGKKNLLNQFLFIALNTQPYGVTKGTLVLTKLGADGRLTKKIVDSRWKWGDMKSGQYEFVLNGTTHVIAYSNFKITTISVGKPDLTITQFFVVPPATGASTGTQFTATAGARLLFPPTFQNIGSADAKNHRLAVFIDGVRFSTIAIPSLKAGARQTYAPPRWTATWGTHTLQAVIDPENRIGESNEANNTRTLTLTVKDVTPPTAPTFGSISLAARALQASWRNASDLESGIAEYQYALGTRAGASDTIPWTSTGVTTYVRRTVSIPTGKTYYLSIRAKNRSGLFSAVTTSSGLYYR